jgi:hypothetical protein
MASLVRATQVTPAIYRTFRLGPFLKDFSNLNWVARIRGP